MSAPFTLLKIIVWGSRLLPFSFHYQNVAYSGQRASNPYITAVLLAPKRGVRQPEYLNDPPRTAKFYVRGIQIRFNTYLAAIIEGAVVGTFINNIVAARQSDPSFLRAWYFGNCNQSEIG